MEDLTGREFGPYRIVAPLGEGGMAAVYKAYQANMDRYVALKVLPRHFANDPEFVARFEQEAKVLAKLRHPHILPVHDYGEQDGYTYLAMPFIESGTLVNIMQAGALPLPKIKRFITQVGDALDYAHSQGIIHRDVKPSNVLVDERENCMLVDFGIAKIVEGSANLTQTGGVLGTPAYMAPEQGRGEALDQRIDIYALGVILYEMATGRVPFKAETPIAVLVKHINDPLPPPTAVNPQLPDGVEQVILKAMAKRADDRFSTAGDMVSALTAAIPDQLAGDATGVDRTMSSPRPTVTVQEEARDRVAPVSIGKQGLPGYVWLIGVAGVGVVILLLMACGLLLFSLARQADTIASGGEATVQVLEPAEIRGATATAAAISAEASAVKGTADDPATAEAEPLANNEAGQAEAVVPTATDPPTLTATPSPMPTATASPTPGPASEVLRFGTEGIGPGQFTDARSVAVDNNNGNIYVGEYTGGRIQVFDASGKFITQWLVDTEYPLLGMDVDRQGNLYVVQGGLIYQYDASNGELIREIPFEPGWGFDDIVVAADGGFVAPWSGFSDDIVRFDAQGEPTLTITEAVSGQTNDSELDIQVAVDGLGNIYGLGTFNNVVVKFGPDGKFLDLFGQGGAGPGTLESPVEIAVDGQGRIYVSELVGPIKIYDAGGQFLGIINEGQTLGMRFDDQNSLFVAARHNVVKYEINLP